MSEDDLLALFHLSPFTIEQKWPIKNGYCGGCTPKCLDWWLVKTQYGLITIGWRKRVIDIDWTDTPFRGELTADDVTKEPTYIHAWGYAKALGYLVALFQELRTLDAPRQRALAGISELPIPGGPQP